MREHGPRFTMKCTRAMVEQVTPLLVLALRLGGPIDVSGAVACIEPTSLRARVIAWGQGGEIPDDAAIAVVHERDRLTVRVARGDARPVERSFSPPPVSCSDAELVVAVAVVIALDAAATPAAAPPVPSPDPFTDAEVPPTPRVRPRAPVPTVRASPAAPREDRSPVHAVALGIGGSYGVLPRPGFEGALGFMTRWRRVGVLAELAIGTRTVRVNGSAALAMTRVGVALGVCAPWEARRVVLSLCAMALSGPLVVKPRGRGAAVAGWVAAAMRSELEIVLSARWSLTAASDLMLGIMRPVVVARDAASGDPLRWATPHLGWRGLVAARLRLGPVKREGPLRIETRR
jgi:hypothetical protein